jgi:hypothetical protein
MCQAMKAGRLSEREAVLSWKDVRSPNPDPTLGKKQRTVVTDCDDGERRGIVQHVQI